MERSSLSKNIFLSTFCDYRQNSIALRTEAAQAVGKVSISLSDDDNSLAGSSIDMMTFVGHKFGARKSIGCL